MRCVFFGHNCTLFCFRLLAGELERWLQLMLRWSPKERGKDLKQQSKESQDAPKETEEDCKETSDTGRDPPKGTCFCFDELRSILNLKVCHRKSRETCQLMMLSLIHPCVCLFSWCTCWTWPLLKYSPTRYSRMMMWRLSRSESHWTLASFRPIRSSSWRRDSHSSRTITSCSVLSIIAYVFYLNHSY